LIPKKISVNLPVLMTFMDKKTGNDIIKDLSLYSDENETSLSKRMDKDGFIGCIVGTGVVFVANSSGKLFVQLNFFFPIESGRMNN